MWNLDEVIQVCPFVNHCRDCCAPGYVWNPKLVTSRKREQNRASNVVYNGKVHEIMDAKYAYKT